MTRRSILATVLIVCFCISAGLSQAETRDITVSAAISLKNAFEEIGRLYEMKKGVKVLFNFGASGDLMTQIAGGAPVDVFASAAQKDMDEADKQGFIVAATRADIVSNSVVLVVPAGAKTSLRSFEGLVASDIKKIAIGNPKTVPAGRYAVDVFNYYKLLPAIKDKFVFTENVRQVLDYVARDEVDAGIMYATDAAARSKETIVIAVAPETSHKPVIYPIAMVKGAKSETLAKAFISLVLSSEGQKILRKYGFKTTK
jgi:molybdate transport system substrate-binding protein